MNETTQCSVCSTITASSALFCETCGATVRPNAGVECENHPGLPPKGFCVVCAKPVCGDCAVSDDGKTLCDNPAHGETRRNWTVLVTVGSLFEADVVERNLVAAGLEVRTFSLFDHVATYWLSQQNVVRVMVRNDLGDRARTLLEGLPLNTVQSPTVR